MWSSASTTNPASGAAVTGEWTADADEDAASLEDLKKGELFFGAPLAVVLLVVFGAVVAGLIAALMLAIASIVVALALVALVAGLLRPVGVHPEHADRHGPRARDRLLAVHALALPRTVQGRVKLDAIATAGATAGRAVLFSGVAFVLAMLGLLLVPSTIFRSPAAGAILVGIVSMIAALTLLPPSSRCSVTG